MSRLRDELYFAPEVKFRDLDLTGERLPRQFACRIAGFYLHPARDLAERCAFAAGLLVVCAIDALALYSTASQGNARIKTFCKKIPDLNDDTVAEMFADHFRNGLVHHSRVEKGSEFSLDIGTVAIRHGDRLVVNPVLLVNETHRLLDEYVRGLERDPVQKRAFLKKLKREFKVELEQ